MLRKELEHLLTDDHLIFHRRVDAIEQQDDRRPGAASVLWPVGGHMRWKLWKLWKLSLLLSLELLKGKERNLLRLSVFQNREVLLAETIFGRMPGRVGDDDVHLHQASRRADHRGGVRRTLLDLGASRQRTRTNTENQYASPDGFAHMRNSLFKILF